MTAAAAAIPAGPPPTTTVTPEPATMVLSAIGLLGVMLRVNRRQKLERSSAS